MNALSVNFDALVVLQTWILYGQSKFISINKQANHNIMQFLKCLEKLQWFL